MEKPAGHTILLNMAALPFVRKIEPEDMIQMQLPAPEEQIQAALEKLGAKDWNDVAASIQDCAVPQLIHEVYLNGEVPQIMELAQCLQELDAQGELPKYKALLAADDCGRDLSRMIAFAAKMDEYIINPRTSCPEDVAMSELRVMIGNAEADVFAQYGDLVSFGRSLLERDHSIITDYGLIERQDGQPVHNMEASQNNAPDYTIMLEVSKGFFDDPDYDSDSETQLKLPATPEDMDKALDAVDAWDWREVGWSCLDCRVPALVQAISDDDEAV